jgi:uncharacterized protein YlxW (UPF0749 family)
MHKASASTLKEESRSQRRKSAGLIKRAKNHEEKQQKLKQVNKKAQKGADSHPASRKGMNRNRERKLHG